MDKIDKRKWEAYLKQMEGKMEGVKEEKRE